MYSQFMMHGQKSIKFGCGLFEDLLQYCVSRNEHNFEKS